MLLIAGVLVFLVTVVIILRRLARGRANVADLGGMSEQWLAEHRASHSP